MKPCYVYFLFSFFFLFLVNRDEATRTLMAPTRFIVLKFVEYVINEGYYLETMILLF